MSTTRTLGIVHDFSGGPSTPGVIFEIEFTGASRAADVHFLSLFPEEEELIFPPFTCLEFVKELRKQGNKRIIKVKTSISTNRPRLEDVLDLGDCSSYPNFCGMDSGPAPAPYGPAVSTSAEAIAMSAVSEAGESERQCWICFESSGTFVAPCKCKGSVRFVHQKCLKEWLKTSDNAIACPQCKFAYRFASAVQASEGEGPSQFDPWPAHQLLPSWRIFLPRQRLPPGFAGGLGWDIIRSWCMLVPHIIILLSYLSQWRQYLHVAARGPDIAIPHEKLAELLASVAPTLFPLPSAELAPFVDKDWSQLYADMQDTHLYCIAAMFVGEHVSPYLGYPDWSEFLVPELDYHPTVDLLLRHLAGLVHQDVLPKIQFALSYILRINGPHLRLLRVTVQQLVVPLVRPVPALHSLARGFVYYGLSSRTETVLLMAQSVLCVCLFYRALQRHMGVLRAKAARTLALAADVAEYDKDKAE
jgi:cytidine deaminase